jgi:hemin uptake protein HemP
VKLNEAQKPTQAAGPRQMSSSALLNGSKELLIVHNGRLYRLRLTKNGKLILTA